MNKKFSTLMTGALLVGSITVASAQHANKSDWEVPFRTQDVTAASLDQIAVTKINKFDSNKYYQLVVNENAETDVLGENAYIRTPKVLVQARDYKTGKLYLKVVSIDETQEIGAKLTSSLWKIDVQEDASNGVNFRFINKETGYPLTFDHENAVAGGTLTADSKISGAVEKTLVDGCIDRWTWYNIAEKTTGTFDAQKLWAFVHDTNSKKVIALAQNASGDVVAVEYSDADAGVNMADQNVIALTPVVAGAKVLSANDINSMIDADGSWEYGNSVAGDNWNKAIFDVFNSGTKDEVELAADYDYFVREKGYVAEEHDYSGLEGNVNISDYAGFNIALRVKKAAITEPDSVLMVSTEAYEANKLNPEKSPNLKLVNAPAPDYTKLTAYNARSIFKFTYFPTQDSLVIEPWNASSMSVAEYQAGTAWTATSLASATTKQFYNSVNEGKARGTGAMTAADNTGVKKAENEPVAITIAYLSDGSVVPTVGRARTYQGGAFANAGLAINSKGNGKAYVTNKQADMLIRIGFDHDYSYLARASKVDGTYFVRLSTTKAASQGEKRVDGSYIVSDFAGHMYYDVKENEQDFNHMPATQWVVKQLGCDNRTAPQDNETPRVSITNREFANVAFTGQLYNVKDAEGNVVAGKYYFIDHTKDANVNYLEGLSQHGAAYNFLNCGDTIYFDDVKDATRGYLDLSGKQVTDTTYVFNLIDGLNNEMFLTADVNDTLTIAKEQLEFQLDNATSVTANGWTKTIYRLKIKDANQIDNDYKYIALDQNHKFVAKYEEDVTSDPSLTMAWFAFKEDAHANGAHYYAMILTNAKGEALQVLRRQPISNEMKVDDLCTSMGTTTTTIFDIKPVKSHIYVQLADEQVYVPANIQKEPYQAFLYEDAGSVYSAGKGMNFVGVQPKNVTPEAPSVYIDLAKKDDYRPLYMFVVDPDSVPAYTFCKDGNIEAPHGLNPSCGHEESYDGYLAGRFMINLQDSVDLYENINKLQNASIFKHNNKTRLAFVEAIHKGDKLYILKSDYTLGLKAWEKKDSKTVIAIEQDGHKYINPKYFKDNEAFLAVIDVTKADDANKAAFALRRVGFEGDGSAVENQFYIETAATGYGAFKGETAAWLKEEDGVAVLAQKANKNGNHEGSDDAINEGINQATPFTFDFENATTPTENETIGTSAISVVATNGAVIVKGAQGKKVVINNVLGQAVANTVITSSEATISVPAGVVFVAVEGEPAVKAIVK